MVFFSAQRFDLLITLVWSDIISVNLAESLDVVATSFEMRFFHYF